MGLIIYANELTQVNLQRVGKFYVNADSTPMPQLKESPSLRIIDPTKAGDGYWNYENMAARTEDVMHALQVLEPDIKQLHQYDWSSGHKKSKDEGLAISSMNFNFDGKGGKKIRDSELSEDLAGDDDVTALLYETIAEGLCSVWFLTMPPA